IWAKGAKAGVPDRLTLNQLKAFDNACREIGDKTFNSMRAPYEEIIREVLKDGTLNVEIGPKFYAIAADAADADFHDVFRSVRLGEGIAALTNNRVARGLGELGRGYFPGNGSDEGSIKGVQSDVELVPYEGGTLYRGVFLRKIEKD